METTEATPGSGRARGGRSRASRPIRSDARILLGGLLALFAVGCASAGSRTDAEGGGAASVVRFTVVNDIVPRSPATVRLLSEDGPVTFLGSVSPDGEETFDVERFNVSGRYALQAETARGEQIRSNPFSLFADAWVEWELTSPTVSVGYAGGPARGEGDDDPDG